MKCRLHELILTGNDFEMSAQQNVRPKPHWSHATTPPPLNGYGIMHGNVEEEVSQPHKNDSDHEFYWGLTGSCCSPDWQTPRITPHETSAARIS